MYKEPLSDSSMRFYLSKMNINVLILKKKKSIYIIIFQHMIDPRPKTHSLTLIPESIPED